MTRRQAQTSLRLCVPVMLSIACLTGGAAAQDFPERPAAQSGGAEAERLEQRGRARFAEGDYAGAAADLWIASQADQDLFYDASLQILRGRAVALSGKLEPANAVFAQIEKRSGPSAELTHYRDIVREMLAEGDGPPAGLRGGLVADFGAPARLAESEPAADPAPEPAAPAPMEAAQDEPEAEVTMRQAALVEPPPSLRGDTAPEPVDLGPVEDAGAVEEAVAPPEAESAPEQELETRIAADPGAADPPGEGEGAEAPAPAAPPSQRAVLAERYRAGQATAQEIERLVILAAGAPSTDITSDDYTAFLATRAGDRRLAAALYVSIEAAGEMKERELAVMLTNLGSLYLEMGELDLALGATERAMDADSSYGNAWALNGLLLDAKGETDEALRVLEYSRQLGVEMPIVIERIRVLKSMAASQRAGG